MIMFKENTLYAMFVEKANSLAVQLSENIPQLLEKTGKSLFLSSEQVVEASQAKFAEFWDSIQGLGPRKTNVW